MGIPLWSIRRDEFKAHKGIPDNNKDLDESVVENKKIESPSGNQDVWQTLKQEVEQCTACDLHLTRKNTVFGVGDSSADWMIIGEAPGAEEDARGEPFVGRAGQLLNQMLLAIGLSRESVFIANILKCRPPDNRDPRVDEVVKCSLFLKRQIEYVKPKVILSVGRVSAQNLLNSQERIGKLRGQVYRHADTGTPIVVTYHPAYLLRSPLEKRKAWSDLVMAKRIMQANQ